MAAKITDTLKDKIVAEYVDSTVATGNIADVKAFNDEFFALIMARDEFAGITPNQIRGILVQRGVYLAHNPRQPAKKGGKTKADVVAELETLVGTELPSAVKMTLSDLELVIKAFTGKEVTKVVEITVPEV